MNPMRSIRRWTLAGGLTLAGGAGLFAAFSAAVPLAEAVMADGTVQAEAGRTAVQHLEGGIVEALLVRDGERVEAGQPLLRLRPVQADAQREQAAGQVMALAFQVARLDAEIRGHGRFPWPAEAELAPARAPEMAALQENLLRTRLAERAASDAVLTARISQARAGLEGTEAQMRALARQIALLREEIAGVETLVRQGLERRPRLLALQRAEASLLGSLAEAEATHTRQLQAAREAEEQRQAEHRRRLAELQEERRQAGDRLADARARLAAASDMTERHEIRAPIAGVVLAPRLPRPGTVARPGEVLFEIVPALAEPEIAFRVTPRDVDAVLVGRKVDIRLPGLVAREAPPLHGVVTHVAPDVIQGPGEAPHYLARARLDAASLARLEGVALTQGFPAQVFVLGRERTLLAYLTAPLADGLRRALREE
jgi:HlyD family type I secretion membrane fusion protein